MLRKLMKYDLRAIFKYWWIIALSSIGLSVVGGASLSYLISIGTDSTVVVNDSAVFPMIMSILGMIASVLGISAFLIATELFIYVRFYQSLFSDEGYLTFTLPVKRGDILNSKLFSALITSAATFVVLLIDIIIFVSIGLGSEFFNSENLNMIGLLWDGTVEQLGFFIVIYIIEAIAILLSLSVASTLFIFGCISFAAVIVKKHKVFVAIGIYYLVSAVMSFAMQILMILGGISLVGICEALPLSAVPGFFALLLLAVALLCAAVTAVLYTVEHYLLDKKLNLS